MKTAILTLFDTIMTYLNGEDLKSILSLNLSEYMAAAYRLVIELQTTVVGPVALALLSIFILLEFQKISMKVEGAGGAPTLGFEMIIKAFIKFIICYVVILKIQLILDGIIAITGGLTSKILQTGSSGSIVNLYKQINTAVSNLSWWEQLVVLLVMAVMFLAALVVRVLVQVTIYIRFLELYVFCAMAPIPMGALPSQEFSAMSKGFFKNFAATGLQSCFIGLVLIIYPIIFSTILESQANGMWGIILGMTVYMIALLFSINKTKGWAKMLVSAN
ncbi:hypothetical protein IGL98_000484 [Enterococcus sp. DIV0840]|uniref:hypothetical protein n=1 Tax=Enterococcus TaxID=1350 RepID=UPI001A8EF3F3|nr:MULTISPECIES: hypothetical protein [Enterococcus]MBO0433527.1 hypothetical protein [Enterococcus sp. DIV0849a]MBO0474624.1 hypothetical protein [Enterococcus ureasiticus]